MEAEAGGSCMTAAAIDTCTELDDWIVYCEHKVWLIEPDVSK